MNRKKCWEENTGNTQNNATEHTKHLPETLCLDFDCCYSCGPHSRWCWSLLILRKPCLESKYIIYFVLTVIWYSPCWDCASPVWNQDILYISCWQLYHIVPVETAQATEPRYMLFWAPKSWESPPSTEKETRMPYVTMLSSISSSILYNVLPGGHVWKLRSLRPNLFNGVQNLWIKILTKKPL